MKLKYSIPFLCLSVITYADLQAQTIDDALIFSREDIGASARIKGLGNAQTALGGDISSINGNPAGLGFFGRSDISITFNYLQNNNKVGYFGTNTTTNKGNFGVDQAGVVFYLPTRSNSGWQNFNMGLSYNKTQNFNNFRSYEGINDNSTIVHTLTDMMSMAGNETFRNDFYDSFIVEEYDYAVTGKEGYFPVAVENHNKSQYNEHPMLGNRSRTAISFGANYNNKFYIGASMGLTSFKYEKNTQFIENGWTKTAPEIAQDNPGSDLLDPSNNRYLEASYELFDNFSQVTEGSGVDMKLGMIFKPAVDWNVGLTINTPTWTTIKDDTYAYTDVHFYEDANPDTSPFDTYESKEYESGMDYNMTTPWKFAVGVAKFFNRGLLTADVEFIDYSTMKYSNASSSYAYSGFADINSDIKDIYTSALNFRIGGEVLLNNALSARAGFNYFGNPYKDVDDKNLSGSLGLGVKLNHSLYLDMAVNHQINSYKEAAYIVDEAFWDLPSPVANIDHKRTNFALTLGAKF